MAHETSWCVQSWISIREATGVLVGASQSEREEETRDRAERGSAVRGSDQASAGARVSGQGPKRIPVADPARWTRRKRAPDASEPKTRAQTTDQQRDEDAE